MDRSVSVNIRIPAKLYQEAKEAADRGGFSSVPELIRQATRDFLKNEVSK